MRTEHIEFLAEISKAKSLNLASQRLCISVQALSASIKNLEEELGFRLLDSTYKGTSLTSKGEELLEAGLAFLAKIRALQADLPERRVISGTYVVNCVLGMMEVILPQFIILFQKFHPNAAIDVNVLSYSEIMENLLAEMIDYSLVFLPWFAGEPLMQWEECFEFVPLCRASYCCQLNEQLHLAQQDSISLKSMLKYDIITYVPYNAEYFPTAKIFEKITPHKEIMVIRYRALFEQLLLEGKTLSLTLSFDGKPSTKGGLRLIPISDEDAYAEIGYLKLRKKKLSLDSEILMEILSDFLKTI